MDKQASVIFQRDGGELKLAVSDPTKADRVITLQLDCKVTEVTAKSEGVQILTMSPLSILAGTKGQEGQSLMLTARYRDFWMRPVRSAGCRKGFRDGKNQ